MKKYLPILAIALVVIIAITAVWLGKGKNNDETSDKEVSSETQVGSEKKEEGPKEESIDLTKLGVDFIKASNAAKSPAVALDRKDTMVIGVTEFNGIFNPFYAETAYDIYGNILMFDSLIEADFDGSPIPGAADYKVSDDGLKYTFTLKEDLKFWDGTPVKAEDVEFAYYVLSDPSYDGPIDISSAFIKGFETYKDGIAEKIEGVKVINDTTIEVTCDKPSGPAIWSLNMPIVSKKVYGVDFKKGQLEKVKANIGNPMGTGQYKYVEYKEGASLELVANENYFKAAPKIKNVVFSVTPSGEELQRVMLGETDIDMGDVSAENIQEAKNTEFINVYRFPTNGYGYVGINNTVKKYQDKKVKQALYYAMNRKDVVAQIYGDYGSVINIPQSKVSWAYNDEGINAYDFDLDKAGKLLDEAGWKLNANGKREKDGEVFTVKFTAMPGHPVTDILLPVMKDDYAKLGIDIVIETLDWPTLVDKVNKKQVEMWFMAWGLTPDPDAKNIYHSQGAQNRYQYKNPQADKLIDDGINETDVAKRKAIYKDLYKVLNDDLPCSWVYQRSDMWVANARVKGLELSSYREYLYNLYKCELVSPAQ